MVSKTLTRMTALAIVVIGGLAALPTAAAADSADSAGCVDDFLAAEAAAWSQWMYDMSHAQNLEDVGAANGRLADNLNAAGGELGACIK